MNRLRYIVRDAMEGLLRNAGAAAAAACLVFVSMLLLGALLLGQSAAAQTMRYLESQVELKVYIEPGYDVREIAPLLERLSFIRSAQIETSGQLLEQLRSFFAGKEQLLAAFVDGALPDAVRLRLSDERLAAEAAKQLQAMPGIQQVVYPQRLAEHIVYVSSLAQRYGIALLAFFLALSFLTVFLAMKLALHQRKQEIRLRLLLGAKPWQVSGQLWLEGLAIGAAGSLLASLTLVGFGSLALKPLEQQFPYLLHVSGFDYLRAALLLLAAGCFLAWLASYASTRRSMDA